MRCRSLPFSSRTSAVGVQTESKRWNPAGFSLICTPIGTNFWSMKDASCGSAYDSASSRAHAPQAGAALKSTSTGLCWVLAWLSAASTSLFQETAIFVLLKLNYEIDALDAQNSPRALFCFFLH